MPPFVVPTHAGAGGAISTKGTNDVDKNEEVAVLTLAFTSK